MDAKLKHLEFIQNVISRLSSKSFLSRGWGVTLVAAAFSIDSFDGGNVLTLLPYLLIITFWVLDSHYLYLETCFRSLYKNVAARREGDIDFSMDIDKHWPDFVCVLLRSHFWFFYVPALIGVTFLIFWGGDQACEFTGGAL
ncbi:hypothetical protein [Chromohalobacter israelensis]|uniref:hypothetical protein n=1 Tax=Chromohalobacter israelensis TaxID=141390 RepID=UPI0015C46407|nr:hypothetical protein [Chromohalobacter salexigens]